MLGALVGCAHSEPYHDWVNVHTYSFSLYTDTGHGTYGDIVDEIEAMNAALEAAFFPNTEVHGMEVLLFSNPESERKAVKRAGVPFVRPDTHPIVLTARSNGRRGADRNVSNYSTLPEQQMASELVNRMLRVNMRHAPNWFRIGLQEYAETVEIEGNLARFGHRLPRPTHELAAGRVIPLGQLIAAPNAEFNGDWRLSHHASAWAFIHFLLGGERGKLRSRFDALARALIEADDGSPAASRAAIEKAFPDVPFPVLENQVRDYATLELGRKGYFHPMVVEFVPPPRRDYPTEPADPQRLRGLLAGLKR